MHAFDTAEVALKDNCGETGFVPGGLKRARDSTATGIKGHYDAFLEDLFPSFPGPYVNKLSFRRFPWQYNLVMIYIKNDIPRQ